MVMKRKSLTFEIQLLILNRNETLRPGRRIGGKNED
jgi:hypothetical protein